MIRKAFLFPGQGSQFIGMGKKIYERYEVARKTFEEANDALSFDLSGLCFEGDLAELTLTKNTQPAILTTSVAMFRVLQEKKLIPDYLAGHSLGEISALTCAGAIDFADAVRLAEKRGKFIQDAVPLGKGSMVAVMTRDIDLLKEICEKAAQNETVVISNYNTRTQQVISGDVSAVDRAVEILNKEEIKTNALNVSAPFHSPLMALAAERFMMELKTYKFKDISYPVVSNVDAVVYEGANTIADKLCRQIVSPVLWADSMTYLKKRMIQYCVEVGSGQVLKNMMKTNISDIPVFAFETEEDELFEYVDKSWFPFVSRAMGIIVATKNNNWDDNEYKHGVVVPYNELVNLQEKIEKEERKATPQEMNHAIDLLLKVFSTKKTPAVEQFGRLKELFTDTGEAEQFKDFDFSKVH